MFVRKAIGKKSTKCNKLFEAAHPICVSELFCLRRCDIMCGILFVWHLICFSHYMDHGTFRFCHHAFRTTRRSWNTSLLPPGYTYVVVWLSHYKKMIEHFMFATMRYLCCSVIFALQKLWCDFCTTSKSWRMLHRYINRACSGDKW